MLEKEENDLSDFANCCEYLTTKKLCQFVSDNEKAKASRQVRCKNEEKMTCCYLCMFVLDCAKPCRFLGNNENDSQQIVVEKTEINSTLIDNEKTEVDQSKNDTVAYCPLCNVKMAQTKTKFRIDGWEETHQKTFDDAVKLMEDVLSAIICLCPKCGKIEFRADETLGKN